MSPPQYKLVYFDARGVAETARFIFAYANVPYEDVRVKHEEWPTLKPKTPFGQLPYLEVNGKPYAQSVAFTRLLAKKYKLAGTSDEEQAQVDAIVDYMKDIMNGLSKLYYEKDEKVKEKVKQELVATTLPAQLDVLENHLKANGKGESFVPSGATFADFSIAILTQSLEKGGLVKLDKYPLLTALVDRVHSLPGIKEWVAKRPQTEH